MAVVMTQYDLKHPTQRKIKQRMDQLQEWMESDYHLENPDEVTELIMSVTKFWSVLQEEDMDFIHGAKYAIEENMAWGNPKDWDKPDKSINKQETFSVDNKYSTDLKYMQVDGEWVPNPNYIEK